MLRYSSKPASPVPIFPSIYLKHFEIYITQPLHLTPFGASDREMNLNGDPGGGDAMKRFTLFTNKVTLVFKALP
jgi:hypothetical protein